MKIIIEKETFLENLILATRFTSSKLSSATALQGVLINNKDGEMEVSATNLNAYFTTKIKSQEKKN